jgi:hypothetical protein
MSIKNDETSRITGRIVFITIICLYVIATVLLYIIFKGYVGDKDRIALFQTITVYCTGVILIWYTWETLRLRQESQNQVKATQNQVTEIRRQTEIQQRPCIIVEYFGNPPRLRVRNVGNGTAINIRLEGVSFSPPLRHGNRFPLFFPILVKDECVELEGIEPGEISISMTVHFENIDRSSYFVREKIEPWKIEIINYSEFPIRRS